MQHSVLKCYTVTLHFKKEGMYNKYLKIQHLFWQVNKQENNHPFSPIFTILPTKVATFRKGVRAIQLVGRASEFLYYKCYIFKKDKFCKWFCYSENFIYITDVMVKAPWSQDIVDLTLLGIGLIKINTVSANFNNPRPSLILNN